MARKTEPRLLLGTSGFSYPDWVWNFYPEKTPERWMLEEFSKRLPTVELDSTFYAIPRKSTVEGWRDRTPEGFLFAAKIPQRITHEKGLVDCQGELEAFLDTMSILGEKLGPLLLQFPYGFRADQFDTLAAFLPTLPEGFRFVVEVRQRKWIGEPFYDLLRRHGVGLALIDHPWMPRLSVTTADFAYIRWLGDRKQIEKDFSHLHLDRTKDLAWWADVVTELLARKVQVFGYMNNHYAGHSPSSLEILTRQLEQKKEGA
jgi:uncharacterized protein YecE (DUF72 family)